LTMRRVGNQTASRSEADRLYFLAVCLPTRLSTWLRLVFSNSSSSAIMEPEKIFSSAELTRNAAAARTLGVWNSEPVSTALKTSARETVWGIFGMLHLPDAP